MKDNPVRPCIKCNAKLRLPADAIEVVAPGGEGEDALKEREDQLKKRPPRKKYVRKPGEELNMSRKMRYLEEQLMRASKRNPKSANYNGKSVLAMMQEPDEEQGGMDEDDVAEVLRTGKLQETKSVVL